MPAAICFAGSPPVAAFQTANGLKSTGRIDAETWKTLTGPSPAPLLAEYTISKEDAAGLFTPTPAAMMERALLKSLDYETVHEALAEKFHCSSKWLRDANRGSRFEAGDKIVAPTSGSDSPTSKAASIRIDKSERVLYLLDKADLPVAAFPASIGGTSDPLPLGRMEIRNAAKDPVFTYDPVLLKNAKKPMPKPILPPVPTTRWVCTGSGSASRTGASTAPRTPHASARQKPMAASI